MTANLLKVKNYLLDLDMKIVHEDEKEEIVVVENKDEGIQNLVIDCEEPIVILEQLIMDVPKDSNEFFKRLLQMNNVMVHGAFAVDDDGKKVYWRDTLELENLDKNELEAAISGLSFAMAENAGELLNFAQKEKN